MPLQNNALLGAMAVAGVLLLETQPPSLAQGPDVSTLGKNAPSRRVYGHLLDPREHPDYGRRAVKPPTW